MSVSPGMESGTYEMVHCNKGGAIWFDAATGSTVRESYEYDTAPFAHILTDFDNFWVDTESPGHFFDEIWARTFQEVGMEGDVEQLTALRWRVYEWQSDVVTSTRAMIQRIHSHTDKWGNPLSVEDKDNLGRLTNVRVLEQLRASLDDKPRNMDDPATLIAQFKEQLGARLLSSHPEKVLSLAPLMPGALEFLESISNEVVLSIVSAGRRKTILEPIMGAYANLIPTFASRFADMMFGEEDGGGHTKPSEKFIERVRWNCAHRLHASGRIPAGGISIYDTLMMGDKKLDTPAKRGGMHHITVGKYPGHLGPLTSHATNFNDLLEKTRDPKVLKHDFTLRKLSHTLK